MVYVFNKYISPKKTIKIALTTIYGIGKARAINITNSLCINENLRFNSLKGVEISKICKYIATQYKVGTTLQKTVSDDIKKHIKIRNYKGIRHTLKLPVRGQRTHTNAKTRKRV